MTKDEREGGYWVRTGLAEQDAGKRRGLKRCVYEVNSGVLVVAPQFFGGGRVTADGVHYVLGAPADGDRPATPAGETEFARDRAFGYRRSRLAEWVAEKTRGSADYAHTWHLSLHAIRGGVRAVQDAFEAALLDETVRAVCVDGLEDRDMLVVASGLKAAMAAQRGALHARGGVVVRSAGSAVAALTGMPPKPFLGREALSPSSGGGLVVVGSYTQKTSAQLAELRRRPGGLPEVVVVAIEGAHQLRLDYEEADVNGDETATSEGSWEVVRQLALEAVLCEPRAAARDRGDPCPPSRRYREFEVLAEFERLASLKSSPDQDSFKVKILKKQFPLVQSDVLNKLAADMGLTCCLRHDLAVVDGGAAAQRGGRPAARRRARN